MNYKRWQRAAYLKQREKHMRALEREHKKLYRSTCDLPLTPIEAPYQQGWYRTFELRPEIYHREDIGDLERILSHINVIQRSRRRDFKTRSSKCGKVWTVQGIRLKPISRFHWSKLNYPEEYRKYFSISYYECGGNWYPQYQFRHLWMVDLVVHPHMVTHQKVVQPEVESRRDRLDELFEQNHLFERLSRLHGKPASWRGLNTDRQKLAERIDQREIREHLRGHTKS